MYLRHKVKYEHKVLLGMHPPSTLPGLGARRKIRLVDAPAYTNCDMQFQNVAPDDGLKSPKHVEHLMINKDTL